MRTNMTNIILIMTRRSMMMHLLLPVPDLATVKQICRDASGADRPHPNLQTLLDLGLSFWACRREASVVLLAWVCKVCSL